MGKPATEFAQMPRVLSVGDRGATFFWTPFYSSLHPVFADDPQCRYLDLYASFCSEPLNQLPHFPSCFEGVLTRCTLPSKVPSR